MTDGLEFKIASKNREFEQISKMIYETFVEEIPRYDPNPDKTLVDKFHKYNTYIICLNKGLLVGMLSILEKRPFSLDHKLENLDSYLPPFNSICEVRLLAVQKQRRYSRILQGLFTKTVEYCLEKGHDIAVISGILKQQKLYKHIGFKPFGPVVGTVEASFQPMYLTPEEHYKAKSTLVDIKSAEGVNLMPGPVKISPEVIKAFNKPSISHRSEDFTTLYNDTKKALTELTNAKKVELLTGSGTLANDVIAGHLSLIAGKGLILTNGEFGERLIKNTERFDLQFEVLSYPWGKAFDYKQIKHVIKENPRIKWLWSVHCETSTGMLNSMNILKEICVNNNVLLCQDCISSIGNCVLDLKDVYLASGVSGKGLCSFSGISMVFYDQLLNTTNKSLPMYMDLQTYSQKNGVPFTINSNLINALYTAIRNLDLKTKVKENTLLLDLLRNAFCGLDLYPVIENKDNCASVLTIALPQQFHSDLIGSQLETAGFLLGYKSQYLMEKNWIQVCLMSDVSKKYIDSMMHAFKQIIKRPAKCFQGSKTSQEYSVCKI
ncbi:MAG: aminotransferase class V-fold PLP-dependent enzyme [Sedimentisphaerales bacterium]|nr:aminotransferase class V-fold PLP-dependent enzyme [Sedimentisphaerales bacterium]